MPVLKYFDPVTDTWLPVVGSPQAQPGLLAIKSYNPGTTVYTASSGTMAAVDGTNLVATFTVPSSGQVLVALSARYSINNSELFWGLLDSGSLVTGTEELIGYSSAGAGDRGQYRVLVTGLTPGATKTYAWGHRRGTGTTSETAYGGAVGSAVMEVWDAQTGTGVVSPGFPTAHHATDLPDADYTLTTTETTIPNWSVIVPSAGVYLVTLTVDSEIAGSDTFSYCQVARNGTNQFPVWLKRAGSSQTSGSSTATRTLTLAAGDVMTVKGLKTSGAGTSMVYLSGSMLSIAKVGI